MEICAQHNAVVHRIEEWMCRHRIKIWILERLWGGWWKPSECIFKIKKRICSMQKLLQPLILAIIELLGFLYWRLCGGLMETFWAYFQNQDGKGYSTCRYCYKESKTINLAITRALNCFDSCIEVLYRFSHATLIMHLNWGCFWPTKPAERINWHRLMFYICVKSERRPLPAEWRGRRRPSWCQRTATLPPRQKVYTLRSALRPPYLQLYSAVDPTLSQSDCRPLSKSQEQRTVLYRDAIMASGACVCGLQCI